MNVSSRKLIKRSSQDVYVTANSSIIVYIKNMFYLHDMDVNRVGNKIKTSRRYLINVLNKHHEKSPNRTSQKILVMFLVQQVVLNSNLIFNRIDPHRATHELRDQSSWLPLPLLLERQIIMNADRRRAQLNPFAGRTLLQTFCYANWICEFIAYFYLCFCVFIFALR